MRSRKTNKKEARKNVIANQFGADTVFTREALYNIVKKNSLFKGTKNNKQLVTNALIALVGDGVLERTGSKKFSTYKLSEKVNRMNKIKDRLTSSPKNKGSRKPYDEYLPPQKAAKKPYDEYLPPQKAAKPVVEKGLLTGLTGQAVRMIMLQKEIEDKVLSHLGFNESKEAAELISEYVLVAAQMMQPQ
jgi:hypothetical protein